MVKSADVTPSGWHTVTPRIVARNANGLVEFLSYVLGAVGKFDPASPCVVTIGDSRVMISEAGARDPKAAFLYVYVGDADSAYRRALERGASSIEEPFDTPYGDRRCMVEDKWGNTWQIAVYNGAPDAA
jgi:PhnB protein